MQRYIRATATSNAFKPIVLKRTMNKKALEGNVSNAAGDAVAPNED